MRRLLEDLVSEMVGKEIPLEMACREFERAYLLKLLAAHKGNHSATARHLGIHRNTLAKKLEPTVRGVRYSETAC